MLTKLFLRHPHSVGESYFEHARTASGVGATMIRGGLACFVHALVPSLCTTTGSDTIKRLYARLGGRVPRVDESGRVWQSTYEI